MGFFPNARQGWQVVKLKVVVSVAFNTIMLVFLRVKLFQFTCICPLQLEKCGVEFDELHIKYNQLFCGSFDADPATLASLNMYPYANPSSGPKVR